MKDVLALQQLEENSEVDTLGWTTLTWTITGFTSTISNHC